jgi:hypothetical protein
VRIELCNKGKVRVLGPYVWSADTGHVCQVDDPEVLGELLTSDAYKGEFALSPDDPLSQIVGSEHTAQMLVVYGEITAVAQLADLTKDEAARLSAALLETPRTVGDWVKAARRLVAVTMAEETAVAPLEINDSED